MRVGLCILALAGCSGVPIDDIVVDDPIGRDGTVYIATPGGELIAYGEIEGPSPGALGGTGLTAPADGAIGQ
jgi:hypothetical protein